MTILWSLKEAGYHSLPEEQDQYRHHETEMGFDLTVDLSYAKSDGNRALAYYPRTSSTTVMGAAWDTSTLVTFTILGVVPDREGLYVVDLVRQASQQVPSLVGI